ncbi:MAG: hypothetical protein ACRCYU_00935 [Nocardioides sp.]
MLEPGAFGDINSHLTQIVNYLDLYVSNPEGYQPQLRAAADYLQNVLTSARQHFPINMSDEATRAAKAASTRYRHALDAEVDGLKTRIHELEALVMETENRQVANHDSANGALSDLQDKMDTSNSEIDRLATKLNAQIDAQRTAYETEATERAATFKAAEAERSKDEEARVEKEATAAKKARESQDAAATAALASLKAHEKQAAALVDTTSRHAVSGDYGTWASRQARAAFCWTVVTVTIGLGTVVGLIYAIRSAADDSIQFTVYKTSISVIGLIVAGYCARQASEHRSEERTAKRLALDLAALDPFLQNVDDPGTLRTEIARRVFAPEAQTSETGGLRTRRGSLSLTELAQLMAIFKNQPPT